MADRDYWHRRAARGTGPGRRRRAQSEPLAALLAVAVVCGAISLYAGVLGDVSGRTGNDPGLAEATADAVTEDLTGSGVIDADTPVAAAIEPGTLPEGTPVSITVTVVDEDGRIRGVGAAAFDASGTPVTDPKLADPDRVTRPVPVRLRTGDVRPGRLVVEVGT